MFSICHFKGENFLLSFYFFIFVWLNLGWDGVRPIGGWKPLRVPLSFLSFIYTYIAYVYTVHLYYIYVCIYTTIYIVAFLISFFLLFFKKEIAQMAATLSNVLL